MPQSKAAGSMPCVSLLTTVFLPQKKLLDDGIIAATICQQLHKQGYLPVELLSRYLIEGISCEEFHYTDIDIRIKENLCLHRGRERLRPFEERKRRAPAGARVSL